VKWGQEFEASRKSSLDDIVGYDATGIYAVKVRAHNIGSSSYTLDHYDNNFALTKSFDLDIEDDGKECEVTQLIQLKNKLYMFYSYQDKKQKKNKLFVDEIEKSTLQPKKQKIKIGEIDYTGNSNWNSGSFSIKVSRDSSKVLAFYSLPDKDGEPEALGFSVLDNNLKSIWEKKVTLPYKDGLLDLETVRVGNDGNVYVLGLLYKEKRKKKRHGDPNYTYEVFAYSNKGDGMKQYTISLDDRFITDMRIEILNNLDKLLIGKDGSAMLIGEQYFVKTVTTTTYTNNMPSTSTHNYYNYNDIIVMKIDPSGQIQWAEKIAKTQRSTDDFGFYSSYALAIVKGKVCLIFNDNPENLAYDGKGRPDNFKARKSMVVIVTLDADGKQTKKPIFNSIDVEVIARPKVCEQISNREVILFGQRKKKQQFARLTFE